MSMPIAKDLLSGTTRLPESSQSTLPRKGTEVQYLPTHPKHLNTTHSTITETGLSYLNSQQFKALSTSFSPDLLNTPFLHYSSLYSEVHTKRDLSDFAELLAVKLFDDND